MTSQIFDVHGKIFEIYTYNSANDAAVKSGCRTAKSIFKHLNKIKKQLVLIDVGANVGSTSISLGSMFKDNIKIYAYEPHPILFDLLVKNIEKYNLIEVVIPFNMSVGSNQVFITKELNPDNTGTSKSSNYDMDGVVKIKCTTLDDIFISNNISSLDVLKVDVEGAEYEIFSEFTLWDRIHKYHIEYHNISIDEQEKIRKFGFYDDMLGPCIGLKRHIMSKLNIDFRSYHTRMF